MAVTDPRVNSRSNRRAGSNTDRAQVFTLEAVIAAVLILGSVAFALQVVAVTANTPSTADEGIDAQHRGIVEGVLDGSIENESLHATLLYWNESAGAFHGTPAAKSDNESGEGSGNGPQPERSYVAESPPTDFGDLLDQAFDDRQVRYNVALTYSSSAGDTDSKRLVSQGTPSDDAVRVAATVTLYEDDRLFDSSESPTNTTLGELDYENGEFYAPNADPDSSVYTVVRVEVVVWTA